MSNVGQFDMTLDDLIDEQAAKECKGEEQWLVREREWEISGEFAEWLFNKWLEERVK